MECSCAIDVYDDDCEPVSLLQISERTARKNHVCQECRREIRPREKYEYVSYLLDGKFYQEKTCADCHSARKQFYPRGGHCPGGLWVDIENEIAETGEIPESCIAQLTPAARARLCDLIEEVTKMLEEKEPTSHFEDIICPGCGGVENAEVEHTWPWWAYVHTCTGCGYVIMESEWEVRK
jgi:ribosomal protein S27E